MKMRGNTVLITGGGTGIGFALAEALVKLDNQVIICGRREQKLREAKDKLPQLHVCTCDVSVESERKDLVLWTMSNFKDLNVLVNNAGIQREVDFTGGAAEKSDQSEVEINLIAPIRLSALFVPHLMTRQEAAIVNVSSGLAFVPLAKMPVYCATKAALHSFSLSLRHQLRNSSIRVFEVIPPMVATELDQGAREKRGQNDHGIPPEEVAPAAVKGLESDEFEMPIGFARRLWQGARTEPENAFQLLNR
jgi:uncharacterized oxidoreductase